MKDIRVKEILLHKAEGVTKKATADNFKKANEILVEWAKGSDVPTLGYDKTDFTVIFTGEDNMYKGTFDLKKEHENKRGEHLLQKQIIFVLKESYGLLPVNEHPFPDYYMNERKKVTAEAAQEAFEFLNNTDFEGAELGKIENILND